MKPRTLFVAPECPWPADIGLKNHSLGMLRALGRISTVSVLGFSGGAEEARRWEALAAREGFRLAGLVGRARGTRLHVGRLQEIAQGRPLSCAAFDVPDYAARLRHCLAEGADLVAFETFWTLVAAPRLPHERVLLFPVDAYRLYWNRMSTFAAGAIDHWRARYLERAFERLERREYRKAGILATVADADARSLAASCPEARVEVIPVPLLREFRSVVTKPGRRRRALVGGYFHTPSIAADLERFLRALARQKPDAEVVVWGRGANQPRLREAAAAAGDIRLVEWVEDPVGFIAEASLYVYPQRFCCGIQTKIQEAMAAGLCVIANADVLGPVGARGGAEGLEAASPEEAAARLREALADPGRVEAIGRRAQARAREQFSLDAVSRRLAAALGWPAPEAGKEVPHEDLLHC